MTAVALVSAGSGTLPKSGPGVVSSVAISDTAITATCSIILTKTKNVSDGMGPIGIYVDSQTASTGFTVKADKPELLDTITFRYAAVEPAS